MDRRDFLSGLGAGVGLVSMGLAGCTSADSVALNPVQAQVAPSPTPVPSPSPSQTTRQSQGLALRATANQQAFAPTPAQVNNGDEAKYPNFIGNFSKGLAHNSLGEVNTASYNALLSAVKAATFAAFETVPLAGPKKLVNPMSGVDFDLEGPDSYSLTIPPAPTVASAQTAGEAVELYWMALLRDVSFTSYATNAQVAAACADLSKLSDFRGPKQNGQVTPATLFQAFNQGLVGPYISQLFLKDFVMGAVPVSLRLQVPLPGVDYMTDFASWLAIQNGGNPTSAIQNDSTLRYIRNIRDLTALIHNDQTYQCCFQAAMVLQAIAAPLASGNPYTTSVAQAGFATLGVPNILTLIAEVSTRALKAMWAQKWFVHRRLRPEAYGGLVQVLGSGQASYPLHADVMNSAAVAQVLANTGTRLLPQAYPEGSPLHPSYGAGHSILAGACTILKAFYKESTPWPNPVVPSADGTSTVAYTGSDAGQMTVGGEINKLANNIGFGRMGAGIHWRTDHDQAMLMGEALAVGLLQETKATYLEPVTFTFTGLQGNTITI